MKQTNFSSTQLHDEKTNLAARELSAFVEAVAKQYGPQEARLSAEAWLEELEHKDSPCEVRSWRAVTIAASMRLAERVAMNAVPVMASQCIASGYESRGKMNGWLF